ncbi:hypothetical protein JX265_013616 [Neoarthrinium moseri]|uniref:Uncharacterized protein n=1 Tax=Neoarthrinium moseri TaxID=1658444 RepID=A0A9P9W8N7_9PEZI|nr:uncharacterized protein JN550_005177 [Neoarthrinium moseri]KAI1840266.1 hypothetical protein JX266_013519 [Neoarthrinium moseri]KAI1849551.1 hypothetical protein JX265_013616 [Neoarthrinium moseri]KAI1870634.1 hypothetical protein JN550_005177 [Neoarthrinium moseri]
MDDNARRRRQNEPPISATSNPRYPGHDPNAQRRSYGASAGASDRYRPAPLNTSPTAARGMGGTAAYSGYYQEPAAAFSTAMPQNTMPYQSEYGQDTRQTQNFGAYNASMMYNVPQAGAQNAVYDTSQQFPSRQPAALQIMPTDVAAPYFPSEPTNSTPATALQGQAGSSGTSGVYQQSSADQRAMLQNYSSGMASMSGMSQTSPPDQVMEDQEYSASAEMGEAYEQYQSALKEIFTNIRNGVLVAASESLLNVSDWLLSKVAELGLVVDNPELHSDRIKLWNDFNHAWLALFQKQKDIVESGVQPQRGQTLITEDGLKKMGKELVRLCDGVERHGLVDYEYGVWEEQIVTTLLTLSPAVIEECLDLYENNAEGGPSASTAGPGHHGSR